MTYATSVFGRLRIIEKPEDVGEPDSDGRYSLDQYTELLALRARLEEQVHKASPTKKAAAKSELQRTKDVIQDYNNRHPEEEARLKLERTEAKIKDYRDKHPEEEAARLLHFYETRPDKQKQAS